jgi:hypothetical protein
VKIDSFPNSGPMTVTHVEMSIKFVQLDLALFLTSCNIELGHVRNARIGIEIGDGVLGSTVEL